MKIFWGSACFFAESARGSAEKLKFWGSAGGSANLKIAGICGDLHIQKSRDVQVNLLGKKNPGICGGSAY